MIPKIIHFCWLSSDTYPILIRQCIKHWQKILPDYEIRLWDTKRFPLTQSTWVSEAFENKKYAFAADYIRAYALYTEGGWYLDSDIWLLKDLTPLNVHRFVSCIESYAADGKDSAIQAAFLGSEAGHPFLKDVLEYYDKRHFVHEDGTLETFPIAPKIYADIALKYGFTLSNTEQHLQEGIYLGTTSLCAPNSSAPTQNSYAIHFCEHSWHEANVWKRLAHWFRGINRTIRIYLSH